MRIVATHPNCPADEVDDEVGKESSHHNINQVGVETEFMVSAQHREKNVNEYLEPIVDEAGLATSGSRWTRLTSIGKRC